MSAILLTVLLLFAYNSLLLAASTAEDIGVGQPPALAPGLAPKEGPLAEPRPTDQVGFPAALTHR